MEIKILGTGCSKCKTLEKITRKVVKDNGIDANITKIEDIVEIMKFNIIFNKFRIDHSGWYFLQCPDKPETRSSSFKEWQC